MIVDENGDPVDDDTVIDLGAMNDVRLDPFYELARIEGSIEEMAREPDPLSSRHTFSTDALEAALTGRYDTVPLASSAAQFAELAGSGVRGKTFGSMTLTPEMSKGLFPEFPSGLTAGTADAARPFFDHLPLGVVAGTSGVGEWASALGSTLTAEMPAVSMLDVMAEAGVDGRRLGFDSLSTAFAGPDLDRLIEGARLSQWTDAVISGAGMSGWGDTVVKGLSTEALDAALFGMRTVDPLADVYRDLAVRSAEIDEMMRPAPIESYAYVPASTVAPSIVERDVGVPEATPVAVPAPEAERVVVVHEGDVPGWVKVGVVFAGWSAVLNTAETVTYWVDRLT